VNVFKFVIDYKNKYLSLQFDRHSYSHNSLSKQQHRWATYNQISFFLSLSVSRSTEKKIFHFLISVLNRYFSSSSFFVLFNTNVKKTKSMEKSLEQLKHIQRISRQTRHHRTHLNQVCDQNLRANLIRLGDEREQTVQRSVLRRENEEERRQLLGMTVKQIARERERQVRPRRIERETIKQICSKTDDGKIEKKNKSL